MEKEEKTKVVKSGNVAIFLTDLKLLDDAYGNHKTICQELDIPHFGKQAFLGKIIRASLPFIQDVIFDNKRLKIDDEVIG